MYLINLRDNLWRESPVINDNIWEENCKLIEHTSVDHFFPHSHVKILMPRENAKDIYVSNQA